jgi:hypothetical protein
MNNNKPTNQRDEKEILIFLRNEYEKTWNHFHFIHSDRTKYVTVFVSLLAGSGYAFFKAVDSGNWTIAISIAIFSGFFNYFFLRWFMQHRISAQYYKNKLNNMRGKLLELSDGDKEIKNIILPTDAKISGYSREYEFYRILVLLIGLNIGAALFLFVNHFLYRNCCIGYLIIILTILLGFFARLCLDPRFTDIINRESKK